MRKCFFIALVYISVSTLAQAQKPGAVIDVQHYEFGLTLNDEDNSIKGNATIEVQVLKNTGSIALDLISKKDDGKGMTVTSITEKGQPLAFTHSNNILNVTFSSPAQAAEKKTLIITYEGIPADGLIITNNKYKHRGFFADNWPNRARNWLPCVDHPADKATVDFIVTAPSHYNVVANGIMVRQDSLDGNTKRTHYKEDVELPMKIMVIGVADFAVQLAGTVENIPVYSWVYPEDKEKGFYDYAQAVTILPFFIKNVGPYAYKKLANVQSKTIFGGLENANTIFYSENSITGTRKNESLITHEIAHQWFGDMATETDWPHLWLSEGFATYMTILYFENKYGKDTATKMLLEDREQTIAYAKKQLKPVVDTSVTNYMQLLNTNSYQKGGWILHMLRQQVGDELFWKGIQQYYATYKGKNASTHDLEKVMETVSGKDLSVFFKQWLFTGGHPVLDISWKYDAKKKNVVVTITQQQENIFQFLLDIQVQNDNADVIRTIPVKQKQTTINIPLQNKPKVVVADPNTRLLFEGSVKEQ